MNSFFSAPVIWQPPPSVSSQSTVLVDIGSDDPEFSAVEEEMQSTIREHRDQVIFELHNDRRILILFDAY
jgi:hypothetical protein